MYAIINLRLHPRDSVQSAVAHLRADVGERMAAERIDRRRPALLLQRLARRGEFGTVDHRGRAQALQVVARHHAALAVTDDVDLGEAAARGWADLLTRRLAGEPLAYLVGEAEFRGRVFQVSPAVLIPRPETEVLIDLALEKLRGLAAPKVLDLGTGSGAILLALLSELPNAHGFATDISAEALQTARRNAAILEFINYILTFYNYPPSSLFCMIKEYFVRIERDWMLYHFKKWNIGLGVSDSIRIIKREAVLPHRALKHRRLVLYPLQMLDDAGEIPRWPCLKQRAVTLIDTHFIPESIHDEFW